MKKSHRILALVMALIFVFTYAGCSASSGAAMKNEAAMDYAAGAPMTYAATTAAAVSSQEDSIAKISILKFLCHNNCVFGGMLIKGFSFALVLKTEFFIKSYCRGVGLSDL